MCLDFVTNHTHTHTHTYTRCVCLSFCLFFFFHCGLLSLLQVYDLLNKQKRLRVLEDGKNQVRVVGLSEKVRKLCPCVRQPGVGGQRTNAFMHAHTITHG